MTKEQCEILHGEFEHTMNGHLGIRILESEEDTVLGTMPITDATRQYFGILHGGASLAFAETLAGCGSRMLLNFDNTKKICGLNVTGNHVGMSPKEGMVYGKATVVHAGRTTHVWNIDIKDAEGRLISTERVTNMII